MRMVPQIVAPERDTGFTGNPDNPVGEDRVALTVVVPEHEGDVMCRGVPTATSLRGTMRGLEILVLVNLSSRRGIDTCDHSNPQTSS